ncbi:hypothetical protein E2C01_068179 [Portunus trituberculatus]|uniref:Uncharacterized protein n=1 Tax=Portunus trituberculatus TaxID=210409 RepID=A0A5B7HVV7_PORTR|nr:hypothetical protein [Portunus trituberculatus]
MTPNTSQRHGKYLINPFATRFIVSSQPRQPSVSGDAPCHPPLRSQELANLYPWRHERKIPRDYITKTDL